MCGNPGNLSEMNYRALDPANNDIRILKIAPADRSSTPVRGSLEHASLNQLPQYVALSYCWGDTGDVRPIKIGRSTLNVTANLHTALCHLRSRGIRRLWVDAICINQADIGEKNKQIYLMRLIYQRAEEVIAWIGIENESGSDRALIKHLSSGNPDVFARTSPLFTQLTSVIQREYWMRVWIIQEIAMAKTLSIYCGRHKLSWDKFKNAIARAVEDPRGMSSSEAFLYQNIKSLIQLRQSASGTEQSAAITLLPTLYQTWMARSADPRDKIFGLLGLASDGERYVPRPDYNDTIENLCRLITLGAIVRNDTIDIVPLLGRGCNLASDDKPSWVPDWHTLDGMRLQRQFTYLSGDKDHLAIRATGKDSETYHASGTLKARPIHRTGILICEGLFLGSIVTTSDSSTGNAHPRQRNCTDSRRLPNPYGTEDDVYRAIYCVLMGVYNCPYSYQWLATMLYIWRSSKEVGFDRDAQAWIDRHRGFTIHGHTLRDWATWKAKTRNGVATRMRAVSARRCGLLAYEQHSLLPYLSRQIQYGVRLMITSTGHIGWARERGQVGDRLYLLKGCSVPVLLRPRQQGGFLVVGDAWVYGFMAGEAVKDVEESAWTYVELH
jgi:Heterokaryon incompatibility protein (HET)